MIIENIALKLCTDFKNAVKTLGSYKKIIFLRHGHVVKKYMCFFICFIFSNKPTFAFSFSEEAQVLAPFKKLQRKGQRIKAARKGRNINPRKGLWKDIISLATFASVLQGNPNALHYETPGGSHSLNHHVITGNATKKNPTNKGVSLLICDDKWVKSLPNITDIYVDGTFDSIPRMTGAYQLFTVMAKIKNRVSIKSKI